MKRLLHKLPMIAVVLTLVGGLVYAFWPRPVEVDVETVGEGPLVVTVNEDGRTRIKNRYVVSAPLAGRMERIPLKPGHPVIAESTVLAVIQPTHPNLLDPRTLTEIDARLKVAEASVDRARAALAKAVDAEEHAAGEVARLRRLPGRTVTDQEVKDWEARHRMATDERRTAEAAVRVAEAEQRLAEAALARARPTSPGDNGNARFEVRSPVTGKVLRVTQESEAVVTPGKELLELGDPTNLEVEVDVLSSDAVKIKKGARAYFEHWGGDRPLQGEVTLVEPAGFMKRSALGVEEQRVWVIIKLTDPLEMRENLGDGYRVEARIVTWESPRVLQVPSGCLFRPRSNQSLGAGGARREDEWLVYVVKDGRASLRPVRIGHNNGKAAEILEGVEAGEKVILHPSDQVEDGVAIRKR